MSTQILVQPPNLTGRTFAGWTFASQTFAGQTFASWTFAGQTFASQTFGGRLFASQTFANKWLTGKCLSVDPLGLARHRGINVLPSKVEG